MTEKENFYALLRNENPEYIPYSYPEYGLHFFGCHHESSDGLGHHSPVNTKWTDVWGTVWHKDLDGVMGFPREFPLADLEQLDSFEFPNPDDPKCYETIYELKKRFDEQDNAKDIILSGSHRDTLWERGYMLVGMENLMAYIHTEPELVKRFFRRLTDFHLGIAKHYVAAGCEMVRFGDDHGMQHSLMLGEKVLKEFFFPEYERLFEFYRNKNIITHFHSCGHIEPILDLFIGLGVDILNPIQASANNLEYVREKTSGKITLEGGVNSDVVLSGTKEEIYTVVKERIDLLGKNGGYICSPDQLLNFPKENLEICREAVQMYGKLR